MGSESGPDVLDRRGVGKDGIQHSDGLGPVPAAAEPRELEALVGRGSHRDFLPACGPEGGETLIRHRDRQRVNGRNEKKVVREREACRLEIWGFCNPTPSSPLYYAM
ncbi:hypothetical protein B296_00037274 [Ensete ventricosum]|uniref:Uncharacterized protein n=1 Tax=Ensete ventricosum TaxID=4639 RepID=A0A426ZAP0_ENSVE|nr:hypothetical protein B296_00037274 [Ensete ventricosum]